MKNLKRLIALVAVFALALTTIASAASFTDVADDSAYFKAVEQLHKIGIIDGYTDGTFGPEKTVTRSEMAKLIAAMQGYAESASGKAVTKFSDVPSTHWASGYIAAATGVAIDGRPDGTFGPEEEVKYEDAVKMIMATLGYTVVANANGGYPMGYVSAAIKEGVTEDVVKAAVGTPASRGTIAQLLYNAIDTPLVEQITWNLDGSGDFIKYDGESKYAGEPVEYKTLMTENLGIVKGEGIIISTNFYGFEADGSIDKEDDLTVDFKPLDYDYVWGADASEFTGEAVLVADSEAENFLGKAVEFFAFQDKYDDWTLLSVVADEAYNKTVSFPIAALDTAKTDAEALYYFKDDAKASTKLAIDTEDLDVMSNNELGNITELTDLEDVAAETGFVTVIDNDKDAAYDAVIIETAESAVVDEIDGDVIVLKGNDDIDEIDTDDVNLLVKLVKDGEEIALDAVAEGDVLSIVVGAGYLVADVMQNVIEGTVTSTKNSDSSVTGTAYKVDGKWYDAATDEIAVEVGDAAKFYIDKFGRIAFVDETVSVAGNFAYIHGAYLEEAEEGSYKANTYTLQILTKDGVKEYEAASKFYIDGDEYEVKNMVKDGSGANAEATINARIAKKLVDVSFSNGAVKKIFTSEEDVFEEVADVDDSYDAEDFEIGTVEFDEDTVVYFVETDVTTGTVDAQLAGVIKKDASYVGTLADVEAGDDVAGTAYFTKGVKADANILVLVNASEGINAASGLAIITDVVEATNADEEDILELEVLYNGEKVALTTTADEYDPTLEIGDIVKIKVNGNKVVTALAKVAVAANDRANYASIDADIVTDVDGTDTEIFYEGYASEIKKTSKKIKVDGEWFALSKFANIYVIDNTGRKIAIKDNGSFKFDEKLYQGLDGAMALADGKGIYDADADYQTIGGVKYEIGIGNDVDAIKDVADYVIIRKYAGSDDVYEMVIIKGAEYSVKAFGSNNILVTP